MRHGMVNRKLGRTSGHRLAMFRNQLASLIDKERIITTLPKARTTPFMPAARPDA